MYRNPLSPLATSSSPALQPFSVYLLIVYHSTRKHRVPFYPQTFAESSSLALRHVAGLDNKFTPVTAPFVTI